MNLIGMGIAIKAIQKMTETPSKKSSSKKETKPSYDDSYHVYKLTDEFSSSSSSHRLRSCVYNIIKNTSEITAVADSLIAKMSQITEEKIAENKAEFISYVEPSEAVTAKYDKACQDVSTIGFNSKVLKDEDSTFANLCYVLKTTSPTYPYSHDYKPSILTLNGVKLDKATFESGANPFETALSEYLKTHPTYQSDYESLMSEVAALEKKKLLLKVSSSKKEELENLRKKFEGVKLVYDQVGKLIDSSVKYKNLTPEQKAVLQQFFEVQSEFRVLSDKIILTHTKGLQLKGYGRPTEIQAMVEEIKQRGYELLSADEKEALGSVPSAVAGAVLQLSDEEFTELIYDGFYTGDGFHSHSMVYEQLIENSVKEAQEQFKKLAAQKAEATQPE